MIATVARKEFVEILRDGRFKWTAAIMVLLLLTALLAGWQRYAGYSHVQAVAQGTSNEQWLKQGDKNPHSAAHYGNYSFKPAGPLAFFDNGVENYTGTAVFMEAHRQNFSIARPAGDMSAISRFGDLTGAMILQVLMPLLIIFLAFTAFSGEREAGTLRQVMSMGVNRAQLLWGKALGIGAAVLLVIVPCILIGATALSLSPLEAAGGGFGARLAVLAASYTGYAVVFLFLTLAVSAFARHARTALMIMVGFWAFTSFLAPKAVSEISKTVHPTPAFGSFNAGMRAHQYRGMDGVSPWARVAQRQQELYREYNVDSVAELPAYWPATRMQLLEELDHDVFDLHFGQVRDAYAAQRRLQDRFGVLAPTLALRSLSMGMAGTDLIHHAKFMQDSEVYRRDMVAKMNGYLSKAAASLNSSFSSSNYMRADESVFAMVPPFVYQPPALAATLNEHRGNLAVLALWMIASILLARWSINKMRVEAG